MKTFQTVLFFMGLISCKHTMTQKDIENQLKKAMQTYLYESINNDSSHVKFRVQDVTFFEDNSNYRCEFHVLMNSGQSKDTTGLMGADISKDFKEVKRKF